MGMNQLFAKKSLKVLLDEMAGEHRLRRVLGPVTLTALGIGAVIGAGIFVVTGAPHKYDQGHFLPNLVAEYQGQEVTQKAIEKKEAKWPDGSITVAEGVYWVRTKREGSKTDALKEEDKFLVVGKVGDPTVEA